MATWPESTTFNEDGEPHAKMIRHDATTEPDADRGELVEYGHDDVKAGSTMRVQPIRRDARGLRLRERAAGWKSPGSTMSISSLQASTVPPPSRVAGSPQRELGDGRRITGMMTDISDEPATGQRGARVGAGEAHEVKLHSG